MTQKRKNKVQLTTRGRHAVSAMIVLAKESDEKPLSLSQIAEMGNISLSYLEQLFSCMRKQGLVKSYRGPGGGYVLAKPVDTISIAEILVAADHFTHGKKQKRKTDSMYPGTKNLWDTAGAFLFRYLKEISLKDVMKDNIPAGQ